VEAKLEETQVATARWQREAKLQRRRIEEQNTSTADAMNAQQLLASAGAQRVKDREEHLYDASRRVKTLQQETDFMESQFDFKIKGEINGREAAKKLTHEFEKEMQAADTHEGLRGLGSEPPRGCKRQLTHMKG